MIDHEGYRPNVGIILCNKHNQVFWGKRVREHSWQFPQGGIKQGETPEEAMYRELYEEIGLKPEHIKILGRTRDWLRYDVPSHWVRREWRGLYRGQKQIWFLLRLTGRDSDICLRTSRHPEFDAWRWADYWVPLENVIEFKKQVYHLALGELVFLLEANHDLITQLTHYQTQVIEQTVQTGLNQVICCNKALKKLVMNQSQGVTETTSTKAEHVY